MCWNYEVPKRQWHAWDWYFQASRVFTVSNGFGFWDEKFTSFRENSTKESQTNYIWRWRNSLEEKILGDSTPQSLLDTMLYMNGFIWLYMEKKNTEIYDTDNHSRKIKPNIVYHHANTKRPVRCFIRLYKLYNSRCPADGPDHAYYLKPLQNQGMSVGIQINQ